MGIPSYLKKRSRHSLLFSTFSILKLRFEKLLKSIIDYPVKRHMISQSRTSKYYTDWVVRRWGNTYLYDAYVNSREFKKAHIFPAKETRLQFVYIMQRL